MDNLGSMLEEARDGSVKPSWNEKSGLNRKDFYELKLTEISTILILNIGIDNFHISNNSCLKGTFYYIDVLYVWITPLCNHVLDGVTRALKLCRSKMAANSVKLFRLNELWCTRNCLFLLRTTFSRMPRRGSGSVCTHYTQTYYCHLPPRDPFPLLAVINKSMQA